MIYSLVNYKLGFVNIIRIKLLFLFILTFLFQACEQPMEFKRDNFLDPKYILKPSQLNFIKFIDNKFYLSWSKINRKDFNNYQLFESLNQDFSDKKLIYSAQNRQDTVFVVKNVYNDEFRYYQIIASVDDNVSIESEIRRASSFPLIVYCSNKNGNMDIFITDIDGENELQVTNSNSDEKDPVFSPDGLNILYIKQNNLFMMDKYGYNKIQLTNSIEQNFQAQFSPDGSKIVFCSSRDGNYKIYLMNVDGTQQIPLTNDAGDNTWPSFMPDGNRIAYVYDMDCGCDDIYLIDADGTNKEQLTSDCRLKSHVKVSPDGMSILYVDSDMPALEDIISFNINTKETVNLTNRGNTDYSPIYSPHGDEIIYQALSDTWDIWRMDANGENKFNITNSPRHDTNPDILYNDSLIVFSSYSPLTKKSQIFTIDKYGNNLQQITNDDYNYFTPKFQKRN